jgi:hypothetical protein
MHIRAIRPMQGVLDQVELEEDGPEIAPIMQEFLNRQN